MSECETLIGWNRRDGRPVPVAESYAGRWPCGQQAVRRIRVGCVHEHVREANACAEHAHPELTDDAVFCCRFCAADGHDCPVSVEVLAELTS